LFASGVVDTGGKFAAGVVDTGGNEKIRNFLAHTHYEGHPNSSYPTRSRSMIMTQKDRTNSAEVIHLLTLMMRQLTNSGSRLAVKS
jgi:hypothetical protein